MNIVPPHTTADRWVMYPRPRPHAQLRMFCFPYAGGGASIYSSWPNHLPPDVEVCTIQLPGHETRMREPPFTRLELLIEALADVLSPYSTKPFVFFGHSLGALICFELARLLRQCGQPDPLHLFVSGCRAPQVLDSDPPIHHLPEAEFIDEVRRLNGTPKEVLYHSELRDLILPILRADFMINETYVYRHAAPLDCPIAVFGGLEDIRVPYEHLVAWQNQTVAACTQRMFAGDHFFLRNAQKALLQVITWHLAPLLQRLTQQHR
jgi:medium-chain acyl-[acyl-carrier-protein] hydrolase